MNARVRFVATLAAVAVVYVLAGRLGLLYAYINASVTAIWPAAGIAVAALLVLGVRAWPAVAIGALLTNLWISHAVWPSLAIAAGNTLECLAAAVLVRRFAHGRFAFERAPDLFRFTAVAALLAPAIAATVGTLTLLAAGRASPPDATMVWFTWWLGDASGIVLITPLCVLWAAPQPALRAGTAETAAILASLAAVLWVVFAVNVPEVQNLPLAVLMLPILLWSAFRFNAGTTAAMSVTTAVIALYRVLHELGPFHLGEHSAALLVTQFLVSVISLLVLSVAIEVGTRARVEAEVRRLNETLERRVAERTAELTHVYDRLAQAQAVAHVGSWEWDVVNDSVWWSDELRSIFGVAHPPSGYETMLALVHPDDRARADMAFREAGQTGAPFSFDLRMSAPGGSEGVVHIRGRVEKDETGRVVRMLGIGHDVTERHRAEEARAQLMREQLKLREAEGANSAKDAFLATLSHELRTPLNAALGWAHILRDSLKTEGRETRAVQAIYRNLQIQSHLVSDILDISHIVKGELRIERTLVDMAAVFVTASDMVREAAAARNVSVRITTLGSPTVIGDTRRLQQVAWNLLSNAVKFASQDGRVTVSIVDDPPVVECSVADDGPGIALEFLPHVFEQFRQADSSLTRQHGGLGLGLAIAHEIVTRHQGTISADNRPGGGALLTVRLPRWIASGAFEGLNTPPTLRDGGDA
jgi:signal transduction histidine kinase/integral membrane sensor domain MASE1